MPRSTLQPLARNRPNTKSSAAHSARLEQRNRPKPCSAIKCNRLLRLTERTAFFVCTLLLEFAMGAERIVVPILDTFEHYRYKTAVYHYPLFNSYPMRTNTLLQCIHGTVHRLYYMSVKGKINALTHCERAISIALDF